MTLHRIHWLAALTLLIGATALAQNSAKPARPIRGNSFFIEEAYNQETRVVQHIGVLESRGTAATGFEFTQEWPLGGMRHQLSYSIPLAFKGNRGIDGLTLSYRYQLRGEGDALVALAPRFSLVLPTRDGRSPGFETSIPASVVIARQLVSHTNAGVMFTQTPATAFDVQSNETTVTLGQSLVWLLHPNVNVLLEYLWTRTDYSSGVGGPSLSAVLSPGIRGALNLPSGTQIVPGIAITFGASPSNEGNRSLLLYLSVEQSF